METYEFDYEDMYDIVIRIQNARLLIMKGETERAERVLLTLENELRKVIYPNDPFKIIKKLKGGE